MIINAENACRHICTLICASHPTSLDMQLTVRRSTQHWEILNAYHLERMQGFLPHRRQQLLVPLDLVREASRLRANAHSTHAPYQPDRGSQCIGVRNPNTSATLNRPACELRSSPSPHSTYSRSCDVSGSQMRPRTVARTSYRHIEMACAVIVGVVYGFEYTSHLGSSALAGPARVWVDPGMWAHLRSATLAVAWHLCGVHVIGQSLYGCPRRRGEL